MDGTLDQGVVEHTGFPNPATDINITPLDINKLLIKHPASTFFMQIASDEWEEQGIFSGDLVIVDRALSPKETDRVIWWDENSFVIAVFHKLAMDVTVWGVVTTVVHRFRV